MDFPKGFLKNFRKVLADLRIFLKVCLKVSFIFVCCHNLFLEEILNHKDEMLMDLQRSLSLCPYLQICSKQDTIF